MGSKSGLRSYAYLLRAQKRHLRIIFGAAKGWLPSGDLESDFPVMARRCRHFLKVVSCAGRNPWQLKLGFITGQQSHNSGEIADYWFSASDIQFFEKALLQPYVRWLCGNCTTPQGREFAHASSIAHIGGGNPQVSFLQNKETYGRER